MFLRRDIIPRSQKMELHVLRMSHEVSLDNHDYSIIKMN